MASRVLTAHIPEELAEKVDRYAKSMERSKGWIVKQALSEWVDWEERKLQLTLDAIADAEENGTITHEEMVTWAESLDTDDPLPLPVPRKR